MKRRTMIGNFVVFLTIISSIFIYYYVMHEQLSPLAYAIPPVDRVELKDVVVRSFETKEIVATFSGPARINMPLEEGKMYHIDANVVPVKEDVLQLAYIVQIKDSNTDFTEQLSWVSVEVPYSQNMNASQSWVPMEKGRYQIDVMVWTDLVDPISLSPISGLEVNVI